MRLSYIYIYIIIVYPDCSSTQFHIHHPTTCHLRVLRRSNALEHLRSPAGEQLMGLGSSWQDVTRCDKTCQGSKTEDLWGPPFLIFSPWINHAFIMLHLSSKCRLAGLGRFTKRFDSSLQPFRIVRNCMGFSHGDFPCHSHAHVMAEREPAREILVALDVAWFDLVLSRYCLLWCWFPMVSVFLMAMAIEGHGLISFIGVPHCAEHGQNIQSMKIFHALIGLVSVFVGLPSSSHLWKAILSSKWCASRHLVCSPTFFSSVLQPPSWPKRVLGSPFYISSRDSCTRVWWLEIGERSSWVKNGYCKKYCLFRYRCFMRWNSKESEFTKHRCFPHLSTTT